jgi:hypothetical protein
MRSKPCGCPRCKGERTFYLTDPATEATKEEYDRWHYQDRKAWADKYIGPTETLVSLYGESGVSLPNK